MEGRLRCWRWLGAVLVLYLADFSKETSVLPLQFLEMGNTQGTVTGSLKRGSQVTSDPINIPGGFPFSNESETVIHVSVNGFLSFRTGREDCCPELFDSTSSYSHIIAPYAIHNDITNTGQVTYEVHMNGSQLGVVNTAITEEEGVAFEGTWMLLVHWNNVPTLRDITETNSYQAILVTDGTRSYALFLYHCDMLQSSGAAIGYTASGNFYQNHPLSKLDNSKNIACNNRPHSDWSTVIYPIHYAGVRASIRSTPNGPIFQAAVYIDLYCYVITPGSYTFSWESYCTAGNTEELVSSHTGFTSPTAQLTIRSTPDTCLDVVVCRAVDDKGSEAVDRFWNTNITGVGVYHRIHTMANNTGLEADSQHQLGSVSCHSASRQPNIGRWITPSGDDISLSGNEVFAVEYYSGNFPSYTVLSLRPGVEFTDSHEGVYSCIIPDENGDEKTVNFGLYDNGYSTTPFNFPLALRRTSENPFILTCTSTHLPPYIVQWVKNDDIITDRDDIASVVTDRMTSTYDNTLGVSSEPAGVVYRCGVGMQVQPYHDNQRPPPVFDSYFLHAAVYEVGTTVRLSCEVTTATPPTSVRWESGGILVNQTMGVNHVSLPLLPVKDDHHEQLFICSGYDGPTPIYRIYLTVIVQVPDTALTVMIKATPTPPRPGMPLTLSCLADKTTGLTNPTTITWSHDMSPDSVLYFSELRTSHAGIYQCTAALASPARAEPLIHTAQYQLEINIPVASVSLTTFHNGSDLTLTCTAVLPPSVDTEVTGVVAWDTPLGMLNETTSPRFTLSTHQNGSHTHQFILHISPFSHSSDDGDYRCQVVFSPSSSFSSSFPYLHPSTHHSNTIHIDGTPDHPDTTADTPDTITATPTSSSVGMDTDTSTSDGGTLTSVTPGTTDTTDTPDTSTAARQDGGLIGTVAAIAVVVIAVVVIAAIITYCSHRRKNNSQIYNVNYLQDPTYELPPSPYPSSPPPVTNQYHHTHTQSQQNGHGPYAVIENGTYSHISVNNVAYGALPPPLPPTRNGIIKPDPIPSYTDSYIKMEPDLLRGQSPHGMETDNPLYTSTDILEPIYSKVTDMELEPDQS